jgi:hypothetical protein
LKQFAKSWFALAYAIDAATEQVNAERLRTIREVNDYIDRETKKHAAIE